MSKKQLIIKMIWKVDILSVNSSNCDVIKQDFLRRQPQHNFASSTQKQDSEDSVLPLTLEKTRHILGYFTPKHLGKLGKRFLTEI